MHQRAQAIATKETARTKPQGAEYELLVATLDRAVLDFYSSRDDLRADADEWMFLESDPDEAFSFEWVCDHLGLNPRRLRDRIKELNFPKRVAQTNRWLRKKVQSREREQANSHHAIAQASRQNGRSHGQRANSVVAGEIPRKRPHPECPSCPTCRETSQLCAAA